MAHLFLSYARQDAARVSSLAAALERDGHQLWWDQQITGGHEFAEVIDKALSEAEAVIVAWTETSVHSAWVRDEAATARDSGRLIPVSLDGTQPPLGFRQYHTIDLSRWTGRPDSKLLASLRAAIAEHVGESGQPAHRSAPPPRAQLKIRQLTAAAAVVLLLLFGGLLFRFSSGQAAAAVTPKVALGQFALLSPDIPPQLDRTMTDEILAAFGSEHGVSVVTNGKEAAPFVLDGSVQRLSEALRFTVNLKDTRTGGLVWSHAFDRALEDSLAPRQVAVAATQVVRCGIWGASAYRKPMSDDALSLYIDWCNEYWGGAQDEDRILDAARRVAAAMPDFSFAWSALALSSVPVSHRGGYADAGNVAHQGWSAAEKAIELDRENPEGYMAEAGLLPSNRFAERERLLRKAIDARPTECGCERQAYGDFLISVGRNDEAVDQYDRARAMMPLAPMANVRLAQALHLVGRHEEAQQIVSNMLNTWPDAEIVQLLQVKSALWTGAYAGAIPSLQTPELHLADDERQALLHCFQALQQKNGAMAQRAATELSTLAADPRRNDRLTVAGLAALKAYPQALGAAAALVRERGPALADVLFEPNLAGARSSPQYQQLVQSLGLTSYWRSSGQLPDICQGGNSPAFCSPAGKA